LNRPARELRSAHGNLQSGPRQQRRQTDALQESVPKRDPSRVRLQPADAFDLIRWLARSQSDPRKAVAELVQNAIDANAKTIVIERRRRGRRAALVVRDDGDGIRPDESRETALRYIATHIGRSHKRNLSARERHEQIVAGQYGIGLLGFWSIGHRMEIRSRVAGSQTWLLRLVEDEPRAEVLPAPPVIDAAPTFTELVVSELHAAALRPLAVRRLAEYLGSELRGPLLASGVGIEIREYGGDGVLVDRAPVVPRRFEGVRLDVPASVDVPGYSPIAVELYHQSGAPGGIGAVELTCAGTIIADRLGDLAALGLDHAPWTDPALAGTIEFAGFAVPPGSRRGVIPDAAAAAFVAALARIEPDVQASLDRQLEQRHAASERVLLSELRRALRGLRDRLPHLELPTGSGGRGGPDGARELDPLAAAAMRKESETSPSGEGPGPEAEPEVEPQLLPPGPAAHVRISPDPVRVWRGGARRVRAIVTDVHGQRIAAETTWTASSPHLAIDGEGSARTVSLSQLAEGESYAITIVATANGGTASTIAEVRVVEAPGIGGPGAGIPEPVLVDEAASTWRSRLSASGWYVNIGHADYRALVTDPRARLRYMVALFAKDVTVATTHAANESVLDQMIDVLAHAERNLLRSPR
jgi:signal transduction histidine kinase